MTKRFCDFCEDPITAKNDATEIATRVDGTSLPMTVHVSLNAFVHQPGGRDNVPLRPDVCRDCLGKIITFRPTQLNGVLYISRPAQCASDSANPL